MNVSYINIFQIIELKKVFFKGDNQNGKKKTVRFC